MIPISSLNFTSDNEIIVQSLHDIGKENIALSAITEAELLYGALNSQELRKLQKHLAMCKRYSLNAAIPDLLIGATAIVNNLELFALNTKDFRFIPEIKLYRP